MEEGLDQLLGGIAFQWSLSSDIATKFQEPLRVVNPVQTSYSKGTQKQEIEGGCLVAHMPIRMHQWLWLCKYDSSTLSCKMCYCIQPWLTQEAIMKF